MKVYRIFVVNAKFKLHTISDIIRQTCINHQWCSPCGKTKYDRKYYLKIIVPGVESKDGFFTSNVDQWISYEDSCNFDTNDVSWTSANFERDGESTAIAEEIHSLADKLPTDGYQLEVIWCLDNIPDIQTHIGFYGALRRLVEWNNAQITILMESIDSEINNTWVQHLNAAVVMIDDPYWSRCITWRGRLLLNDGGAGSDDLTSAICGLSLVEQTTGQELQQRYCSPAKNEQHMYVSNHLELLDEVDTCSILPYVFSGKKLKLCLSSNQCELRPARSFIDYVNKNEQTCILVRMWCSHKPVIDLKEKVKGKERADPQKTDTQSWKENLIQNKIMSKYIPPLQEPRYQFVFALIPAVNNDEASCPCVDFCWAYVLHRPEDFNQDIVRELFNPDQQKSYESNGAVQQILDELPTYDGQRFMSAETELRSLQEKILMEWLDHMKKVKDDDNLLVPKEEAVKLFTFVREAFYAKVKESLKQIGHDAIDIGAIHALCISELDINPDEWLERLSLSQRQQNSDAIQSLDTTNKLPAPPKEDKDESLTLNAEAFAKLFTPNGHAVSKNLSPLIPKSTRSKKLPKYNSGEARNSNWPECFGHHSHGMYYCRMSQPTEHHLWKRRDRYVIHETASTCNQLDEKSKPTTLAKLIGFRKRKSDQDQPSKLSKTDSSRVSKKLDQKNQPDKSEVKQSDLTSKRILRPNIAPPSANRSITIENRSSKRVSNKRAADGKVTMKTSDTDENLQNPEKRSDRHKRKLESIVSEVLQANHLPSTHEAYNSCKKRLFNVVKSFLMGLKSSRGLSEEMRKVAEAQVKMVIDFELKNHAS